MGSTAPQPATCGLRKTATQVIGTTVFFAVPGQLVMQRSFLLLTKALLHGGRLFPPTPRFLRQLCQPKALRLQLFRPTPALQRFALFAAGLLRGRNLLLSQLLRDTSLGGIGGLLPAGLLLLRVFRVRDDGCKLLHALFLPPPSNALRSCFTGGYDVLWGRYGGDVLWQQRRQR